MDNSQNSSAATTPQTATQNLDEAVIAGFESLTALLLASKGRNTNHLYYVVEELERLKAVYGALLSQSPQDVGWNSVGWNSAVEPQQVGWNS